MDHNNPHMSIYFHMNYYYYALKIILFFSLLNSNISPNPIITKDIHPSTPQRKIKISDLIPKNYPQNLSIRGKWNSRFRKISDSFIISENMSAAASSLLSLPEISVHSFTKNPKKKNGNGKIGVVKVRCLSKSKSSVTKKTKYCDVKISDVYNLEFSSHFSAPVKEKQQNDNKDDEEKQNYYVNSGYAIRTLREEFPQIFYKELNFDIYRDDIVFKDPLNTFVGIKNYKSIFWALRFYGKIFFKGLWVDIINVSQPIGVDKVIMVRWTIHGIPRVPWESHGRFDGTSEYKLDKHGKIYEHKVDNIALTSPPKLFRVQAVEELIQSLGIPSTPRPTYFEVLSSSVASTTPFILRFTWVRYYLAFKLALSWRSASESRA